MKKQVSILTLLLFLPMFIIAQSYGIEWTNIKGVEVSKSSLTKTANYGWNAGAVSKNKLAAGEDGWIESTIIETNKQRYFGFSKYNQNETGSSIDFAFLFHSNSYLYIFESGVNKGHVGRYAANDVVKIERIDNKIHFFKNDERVFLSDKSSTTDLIVDVAILQTQATVSKVKVSFDIPDVSIREGFDVVWTNEVSVKEDKEVVVEKGTINETKTLVKTGPNGWNGGAASKNTLEENRDGWLEFSVAQTDKGRMIGFSKYNKDDSYTSIQYAIYLHANGTYYVYENGASKGVFGNYYLEDIFSVERSNGEIVYKKNGRVFYSSTNKSTEQLIVDVSIHAQGGTLTNVRTSFPVRITEPRKGFNVEWTNQIGVLDDGNELNKINANGWGTGGAASKNKLASETDGWVETTVVVTDKYTSFGLSPFNKDAHHNSIHYAIFFHINGTYYVYEEGQSKGTFGKHYKDDIFSVEREGDKIYYRQNGRTFYVSTKLSKGELIVDAAIHNTNAKIMNARTSFDVIETKPREGHDVVWTNEENIEVSENSLKKIGVAGWNGGAASKNILEDNKDGWMELSVLATDKARMVGLAKSNKDASYTSIDFAYYLHSNGHIYVYEKGVNKGDLGIYYPEDLLSIEREKNKIFYKQNGRTVYVSAQTSNSTLLVDASLNQIGGTLTNVRTSFPVKELSNRDGFDVVWTNGIGVDITENSLTKTGPNGWSTGGAASKNNLAEETDGWLEVTVQEQNTQRMFGFSKQNKDAHYTTINFALYTHSNGAVYVYENGASKGSFGRYYTGDILSVEREKSKILYKKNGNIFYTSATNSTSELIVDVALQQQGSTISNARTSFDIIPIEPRDGFDVIWTNIASTEASGNDLTKLGGVGWNGAAASKNILEENQDGWIELTASETDKRRMIGLTEFDKDKTYTSIDYTIYLNNNGHIYIYEKGANKGDMGFYYPEDLFSIEREGGKIYYKKNRKTIFVSEQPSTSFLLVDVSMYDPDATLKNVRTSFPVQEIGNRDGFDVVWTEDVGVAVRGNTIEKTLGASWANAGAASKNLLPAGQDGWVEGTLETTNTARILGLSLTNVDANYTSIPFAIYAAANGTIEIFESGKKIGTFGTYYSGDIASIEREKGSILYKLNGRTLFISTALSADPLIVDASLYTQGATIKNTRTSFGLPSDDGNDDNGIVAGSDGIPVVWTNLRGTAASYNSIKKIAANGWGNGGAVSENLLKAREDGWAEILVLEIGKAFAFGLSKENTDYHYTSIDYALVVDETGNLSAYEKGVLLTDLGTVSRGDLLAVERKGTQIVYKKNNEEILPSKAPSEGALIIDVALNHTQGTIFNAIASFGIPEEDQQIGGGFFIPDDHEDDTDIRYSNGKIVMGNDSLQKPGNFRLLVEDGILTEEVVIAVKNTDQWADYVFEKDYPLKSIPEIADFIENNKHLPNVPSAQAVVEQGMNVQEMNVVLLRQIEELWLHLIEIEQKMEILKSENKFLKQKESLPEK